ncbi:MAG: hypothetical protein LBH62_04875 [Nitrososphaerota archaeon]|nr:hypothetical protein [Nitrososphaerota archaeon]
MTEEVLLNKMVEFFTSLDQVKEYRKIASTLVDFALIFTVSVVVLLTLHFVVNFLDLYGVNYVFSNSSIVALSDVLIPCFGILIGFIWVKRKVAAVKTQQWENAIDEGTPGALKLLQEINWDNIFSDIRFAKLGFVLYGVIKVVAYWLVTVFMFTVGSIFLVNFFHFVFNFTLLIVVSFILVLVLSGKDIWNRYEQVGRLDSLLWELRWFEREFRNADFQA